MNPKVFVGVIFLIFGLLSPAVNGFSLREEEGEDEGDVDDDEDPGDGPVTCPAGSRGPGGLCLCESAAGYVEGEWARPWCWEGRCFTGQAYAGCQNATNGHRLGDGTWCWNNWRNTRCASDKPMSCPAGKRGEGGLCDCTLNPVTQTPGTKWQVPWCYEGVCYTAQHSGPGTDLCVGKGQGYQGPAGSGTWCFNERRDTRCPTTAA